MRIRKIITKKTLFVKTNKKISSLVHFLAFDGHLREKNQQTNERSIFLFVLAKSAYFVLIFLILI